jgi:hypothetical protein
MKLTRNIIEQNIGKYDWLSEFETVLSEIESNLESEPDITIESCKSLLESIAKTILINIDPTFSEGDATNIDFGPLMKRAKEKLLEKSSEAEDVLMTSMVTLSVQYSVIRNKRGDISHGRILPKEKRSSVSLAKAATTFTDGFASYLLYLFLLLDFSYKEPIKYEDNDDFNDVLDANNPIAGISYSKALFDQDFVAYEEALEDYKNQIEDAEQ